MLLTPDEYRRGVVRWTPDTIRNVTTASRPTLEDTLSFSEPLSESRGSISTSPTAAHREIDFEVCPPADPTVPCRISWDRWFNDDIDTMVFDVTGDKPHILDGVVGMGPFRRIVVATPYLEWKDDLVIRVQDVVLRFYHDVQHREGEGNKAIFVDPREADESVQSHPPEAARYIEIIVPEPDNLSYEPAFSALGLIALHVGDASVGSVVANEARVFNSDIGATERSIVVQGLGSTIPSSVSQTFRIPITIPHERFEQIDDDLTRILQNGQPATSLNLALRWYEQSLRSFSETDRLLSSVVGIEAVVTRVSALEGFRSPIADVIQDERIPALLEPLRSQYGPDKVNRLLARLIHVGPSVRDRFAHFCAIVGWNDAYQERFRAVSDARNKLVHGSTTTILRVDAVTASRLLADVLSAALAWERRRSGSFVTDAG
ncbi:MAG: hypothetical protein AVDCRST_MAG43-253 [uncultured Thermomicrobiales bacterium]|uniref:Apea-like HEPN domain-containing protein n=1 Tax=uncultured Thermomicrobiales bacterium TaxID=1645740 RepID=A0A6J4U9N4_9BACT|nr:MAG: hypothetical protein AVDCRST_MAG43-253 [uncultured Thermomicrobiales bacterium]